MLCKLGSTLAPPVRELVPALRTLGSRLRILLVPEKRPPMSSSASKEKARRCLDQPPLPSFLGFFSDTTAPSFLLLLLAKKKSRNRPARAAMTMGTAMAAFSAGWQERLLHDFSDTVTAPVVLLAAFEAVLVTLCGKVEVASAVAVVEVEKVVCEVIGVEPAVEVAAMEFVPVLEVWSDV